MTFVFEKYHGLGNDFILVRSDSYQTFSRDKIAAWCDRNRGIGADGVIWTQASKHQRPSMKIWNADGTTSEMCGNGIRCLAWMLYRHGDIGRDPVWIETDAGPHEVQIVEAYNAHSVVTVQMKSPQFDATRDVSFMDASATYASMGNQHIVIFEDRIFVDSKELVAAEIVKQGLDKTFNVGVARVKSPKELELFVYERGAGFTLACGTGACAAVAVGIKKGILLPDEVTVILPGGAMTIVCHQDLNRPITMIAQASYCFQGQIANADFYAVP